MKYYIVQAYSGFENKVRESLGIPLLPAKTAADAA